MEEILDLIEEAADSGCAIHLHYGNGQWLAELGDDIKDMSPEELKAYIDELESRLALLDEQEPEDEDSEEYDIWADAHEELEDILDDCVDRLEDLE